MTDNNEIVQWFLKMVTYQRVDRLYVRRDDTDTHNYVIIIIYYSTCMVANLVNNS